MTKVCGYALLGLGSRHAARLGTRAPGQVMARQYL